MRLILQGVNPMKAVRLRSARQEDAAAIARLFLLSSDGLAAYIWSRSAPSGADILEIGTARYARINTAFSYQNCHLAEVDGRIAGMLHAFEMETVSGAEPDPILRPYAELELPGSFYISGLAIHPEFRRRGIARQLMGLADNLAIEHDIPRLSLICFDQNTIALGFYQMLGFRQTDRRALVPHPCLHFDSGFALLLTRDIASHRRRKSEECLPK